MATNADTGVSPDDDSEEEFGVEQIKELGGFLLRSPRRRPKLAAGILVVTVTIGFLLATFLPRSYHCDVRLLAQKNLVRPTIDRGVPQDSDSPTKNVFDAIQRRDNIVALVKQLDLVDRWQATRPPLMRFKDKLFSFGTPRSEEDKLHDMVDTVSKKLTVAADESSITIGIEWPDRETAFDIVSLVQKNFLEARYDANVSVIVEAIRILEERAKPQAAEVDSAIAELTRIEAERGLAPPPPPTTTPPPTPGVAPAPRYVPAPRPAGSARPVGADSEVAKELADVRRRLSLMKEARASQLAEAERALVDARASLGPRHPTVVALNEKIAQLQEVSPEIKALDARERELVAQLAASAAATPEPAPGPAYVPIPGVPAPPPTVIPVTRTPTLLDVRDDSRTSLAKQKLATASGKYNELLSRIEQANVELEVTRAAFKFQYIVVRPAELPRRPSKPNAMLIILASVAASLLFAVGVPGAIDLLRGRLMERWQVERRLKLPVIGDLSQPR